MMTDQFYIRGQRARKINFATHAFDVHVCNSVLVMKDLRDIKPGLKLRHFIIQKIILA